MICSKFKDQPVKIHTHRWWGYRQANIWLPSPSFHPNPKDWWERQSSAGCAAGSFLCMLRVALQTRQHLLNGSAFIADLIHCGKQWKPGWGEVGKNKLSHLVYFVQGVKIFWHNSLRARGLPVIPSRSPLLSGLQSASALLAMTSW